MNLSFYLLDQFNQCVSLIHGIPSPRRQYETAAAILRRFLPTVESSCNRQAPMADPSDMNFWEQGKQIFEPLLAPISPATENLYLQSRYHLVISLFIASQKGLANSIRQADKYLSIRNLESYHFLCTKHKTNKKNVCAQHYRLSKFHSRDPCQTCSGLFVKKRENSLL